MITGILIAVAAALAAILGIKWRASSQVKKADDARLAAEKKAGDQKVLATEARAESESHAEKVDQANEAVGEMDDALEAAEHRAKVLEEATFNAPKIDPTDPRPGASRLQQAAGTEAVPGVHRDPGEDR